MSTETIKTDEICDDPKIVHLKKLQMDKLAKHSFFSSIGESCKFIAGPMFGIGIGAAISAGTVVGALPIALLATALSFLVIGVASSYHAARIWHDGQFNNYEISAKSTAHHMVEELKANSMCFTEGQSRADGKSWAQYTGERKAVQPSAQIH